MLDVALALIISSAVFALIATVPALGFGGKILPGYAFKAKGEEARKSELFVLRSVALLIYSFAIFLSAYGVVAYFYDTTLLWILIGANLLVVAFWVWFFLSGKMKKAIKTAKELSEE